MKPVLIITDMQRDFINYVNSKNKTRNKTSVITKNISSLRTEFRKRGLPIIYLKFINVLNNKHVKKAGWNYCIRETKGSEIIDDLKPEKDEVIIEKSENSGFYSLELKNKLKELTVDTLILTGIQTHICILSTASDGYANDYDVIVLKDCVTSSKSERKKWALWWINRYVGKVIDSKNLLSKLC